MGKALCWWSVEEDSWVVAVMCIEQGVAGFGESLDMQSSVIRRIKDALGKTKMLSLWRRRRALGQRSIFCNFDVQHFELLTLLTGTRNGLVCLGPTKLGKSNSNKQCGWHWQGECVHHPLCIFCLLQK